MTQTRSSSTLLIQLTPMQIPEAVVPQAEACNNLGSLATSIEYNGPSLLLHPGEASEMVVQVKNLKAHKCKLQLKVEGNFPSEWCHLRTEGEEISPGAQMEALLYFQVPINYFEEPQALSLNQEKRLVLDFRAQVVVYANLETNQEYIQYEDFSLYLRPRSNFVNFLPVLYREVDFIGRFMKIFEQSFEPVIQSFNVMWANLDPLTAPETLLPFLAHWVAWPTNSSWTPKQQRRLIRRAVELYRWRGTRKGLRLYLHLYTGLPLDEHLPQESEKHISITEPFGEGFIVGSAELGKGAVLGGGRPYHFVVHLYPDRGWQIDEQLVRSIIEQEKPAFSTYELLIEHLAA